MSTAAAEGTRQRWEGSGVSIAEVLHQLARQREPEPDRPPLILTAVLDLVAYLPGGAGPDGLDGTAEVIEHLFDHQPSRAILVSGDGRGPGIDAAVETGRREVGGGTSVAVQLVELCLPASAREGVASALLPLLRASLPTVLWWPSAPAGDDPALARLARLADRVVTEAGRAPDAAAALGRLAGWVAGDAPPTTDLAWAAITPWRQLVGQMVDADALGRLRSGTSQAIVAHPGESVTLEALLLAGWLSEVIGEGLQIALLADPRAHEGGISSLELESAPHRRLEVTRVPDRASASVLATSPSGTRRRVLPLPSPSRAPLLAGELEIQRPDRAFESALAAAARRYAG